EVDPDGKMPLAGLVDDRPAVRAAGEVAERPGERLELRRIAHRVAEGDPGPAADRIHEEGAAAVGEEEALVAGLAEPGQRVIGGGGKRGGAGEHSGGGERPGLGPP